MDQHRLSAAAMSTRHDFVFAAQHLNHERFTQQNFRLSCGRNDPTSADSMIFFILSGMAVTLDGSKQCGKRMSGSAIPNLPLLARSHHFAVQQTDSLLEQNRNRKMISLKTISEKLNARRRYRDAVSELSKLSDHELSDIGISRGDIEYVARRPVASKASA